MTFAPTIDGLRSVLESKRIALHRGPAPRPAGRESAAVWISPTMRLGDGRPFRVLTVVDQWSRQSSDVGSGLDA